MSLKSDVRSSLKLFKSTELYKSLSLGIDSAAATNSCAQAVCTLALSDDEHDATPTVHADWSPNGDTAANPKLKTESTGTATGKATGAAIEPAR